MKKIPPFKPDERSQLHIVAGAVMFCTIAFLLRWLTTLRPDACHDIAFADACICAIGKECYDKWLKPALSKYKWLYKQPYVGKFDFWDMAITIAAAGTLRSLAGVGYSIDQFVTFFNSL